MSTKFVHTWISILWQWSIYYILIDPENLIWSSLSLLRIYHSSQLLAYLIYNIFTHSEIACLLNQNITNFRLFKALLHYHFDFFSKEPTLFFVCIFVNSSFLGIKIKAICKIFFGIFVQLVYRLLPSYKIGFLTDPSSWILHFERRISRLWQLEKIVAYTIEKFIW